MKSKNKRASQLGFLSPSLTEQLNPKQELFLLSTAINWKYFEEEFSSLYSGRAAHRIRLMVSLLILKSLYNLSDEQLVEQQWEMNQ